MGCFIYIFDELIIGLYVDDISCLLKVLNCIVENGDMVVIIEYNFDVIKMVDYIIDLGLEGGEGGGIIIVIGIFEEIV